MMTKRKRFLEPFGIFLLLLGDDGLLNRNMLPCKHLFACLHSAIWLWPVFLRFTLSARTELHGAPVVASGRGEEQGEGEGGYKNEREREREGGESVCVCV